MHVHVHVHVHVHLQVQDEQLCIGPRLGREGINTRAGPGHRHALGLHAEAGDEHRREDEAALHDEHRGWLAHVAPVEV